MIRSLKVAVIQMAAGPVKEKNLRTALRLTQEAAQHGAQFILLPEVFNYRGKESKVSRTAEDIPGPSLKPLMAMALKERVWILAGSIGERAKGSRKVYNSSVLINDRGRIEAVYRKIHLFDVRLQRKKILESAKVLKGSRPALTRVAGIPTGLSVCYDLRFPELFYAYAKKGALLLCVPSSFTWATGKDHWEVLLRARAIENQCFVLAPNQYGVGSRGVKTYGNSMVIDPWGRILARAATGRQKILYAKLDFKELFRIRKNLPSLEEGIRTRIAK